MMYLGDKAVGLATKNGYTLKEIAENGADTYPQIITLPDDVVHIADCAFIERRILRISGAGVKTIGNNAFSTEMLSTRRCVGFSFDFPNLEEIGSYTFAYCNYGNNGITTNIIKSKGSQFERAVNLPWIKYTRANSIGQDEVYGCASVNKILILTKPAIIHDKAFRNAANLIDIYVPWSEGEVENAPWGATKATIHYNTVFDENGEVTSNA